MSWPFVTPPNSIHDTWMYSISATDELEIRFYYETKALRCYLTHFGRIDLPGLKHPLYGKEHQIEISIEDAIGYLDDFLKSQEKVVLLLDPSCALREFIKHFFNEGKKCIT